MANTITEENIILRYIMGDKSKFNADIDSIKKRIKSLEDIIDESKKALLEQSMAADTAGTEIKDMAGETDKARKSVKNSIKDFKIFGKSINDVIGSLQSKKAALGNTVQALGGATKGLKAFRIALAATGIGLIIVALTSLVAAFRRTTEGADILSKIFGGIGATIDVLVTRFTMLGSALISVLRGDIPGAAQTVKDAFTGINAEISESIRLSNQLVDVQRQLKNDALALTFTQAVLNKQIKEANLIGEDTNNTFKVREEAIQRSLDKNIELLQNRKEFNLEEQKALRIQIRLEGDQNKALELRGQLADKIAEGYEIETQFLEVQTTQNNKLNTIRQQASAERLKRLEEERKLREQIEANNLKATQANEDIRTELLTSELQKRSQQLILAANRDIAEINQLVADGLIDPQIAQEQINLLGEVLNKGLIDLQNSALASIGRIAARSIGSLVDEGELLGKLTAPFEEIIKNFGKLSDEGKAAQVEIDKIRESFINFEDDDPDLFKVVVDSAESAERETLSIFQRLGRGILDTFDQETLKALQSTFGNILDGASANVGKLVDENQQLIDSSEARLEALRESEDASAAAIDAEEQRLSQLQEQREQFLERQRRIQAAEIALNAASSISEAIKSIISGFESGNPLLGILNAAALAATVISTIGQIKGVLSTVPAFAGGTESVPGVGGPKSDNIPAWLSPKERVLTVEQNKPLLRAGISNKELPGYALLGQQMSAPMNSSRFTNPGPAPSDKMEKHIKRMADYIENLETNVNVTEQGIEKIVKRVVSKRQRKSKAIR